MIYTGITIGPIIKTLSLARKPRELWIASYMFSHLMECIVNAINASDELKKATIISPGTITDNSAKVGLYPDRVFIRSDKEIELDKVFKTAKTAFRRNTRLSETTIDSYFNIMYTSVEATEDKEGVRLLNTRLNYMELVNIPIEDNVIESTTNFIADVYNNPLYKIGIGANDFLVSTLAEIATDELKKTNKDSWTKARDLRLVADKINSNVSEESKLSNEDYFYTDLQQSLGKTLKSHHKYICVVQADGDNMGKIVSNIQQGKLLTLSNSLLDFGNGATAKIKEYGGLPIYAGGDDLLFIAPVVSFNNGKQENILDLIDKIDNLYKKVIDAKDETSKKDLTTGMTYGVSITYYKYPLYEALASARTLLFDVAKKIDGKNAIAWKLQKHSGGSFVGQYSKSKVDLHKAFKEVISNTDSEKLVSAVAHKLKSSETLLKLILEDEKWKSRWDAFADKTLEYKTKSEAEQKYLDAVKELVFEMFGVKVSSDNIDISDAVMKEKLEQIYGMLRTAKFIKGEETKDEE